MATRPKDAVTEAIAGAEDSFAGALGGAADKGETVSPVAPVGDDTSPRPPLPLSPTFQASLKNAPPVDDEPFVLTDRNVQDEIEKVNRLWNETNPTFKEIEAATITGDDGSGYLPPFDLEELTAQVARDRARVSAPPVIELGRNKARRP